MRIIIVSIASVFVFCTCLLTVKLWGRSQSYPEYKHPLLSEVVLPITFVKVNPEKTQQALEGSQNLYLDVFTTQDQRLVLPKIIWASNVKPIRYSSYEEVKDRVLLLSDYKDNLKSKKIIFNIFENTQAIHEIFLFNMQQMGFEKGENYIVTSQYEAPLKSLKEIAPALVYGSTQPEILKIVAMQSMYLVEAASIRADVIIHPLQIHKQDFFNDELMAEFKKRHKKIVIGPLTEADKQTALELHPFGIILAQ